MSSSLTIKLGLVEQQGAIDPVEARTWCSLSIVVGGRTVTRIWDKAGRDERSVVYIPTFALAEWVAENW